MHNNKFMSLGDNCRLHGMTQFSAQEVIDNVASCVEESDAFWEGFFYGTATEIVSVHGLFPVGYLAGVQHLFLK